MDSEPIASAPSSITYEWDATLVGQPQRDFCVAGRFGAVLLRCIDLDASPAAAMVYRGKPSKGCGLCRKRKIKCDQVEPSCGQCLRAHKTCPGYRDLQALMFQDESEHVIRKVQKESLKRGHSDGTEEDDVILIERTDASWHGNQPSFWSSEGKESSKAPAQTSALVQLCQSMGQNLEDTATAFFFQNFVKLAFGPQKGFMDYIPKVFNSGPARGALSATIVSVGMAGLSNITSNPGMLVQARTSYDRALALTRNAIFDPEIAKSDDMVVAVLLLSIFETLTCNTPEAMEHWTDHMKGAIALLTLRGPQQLETLVGRQIFFIARAQIVISCIQRNLFVPEEIKQLSSLASTMTSSPDAEVPNALVSITTRFCNMRAFVKQNPPADLKPVIASFLAIDAEIAEVVSKMGPEWDYQVRYLLGKPHETYDGSYHVYKSFWHANIYSNVRSSRTLVNELLLEKIEQAAETADEETRMLYDEMALGCRQTLMQLTKEICASVPYCLGLNDAEPNSEEAGPLPAYGGYVLMWPLFLSAVNPTADPPVQKWISQRLEYISKNMGIAQAHALALVIRRQMSRVAAAKRLL